VCTIIWCRYSSLHWKSLLDVASSANITKVVEMLGVVRFATKRMFWSIFTKRVFLKLSKSFPKVYEIFNLEKKKKTLIIVV